MVDFSLPALMPQRFIDLIPEQRIVVNRQFIEGKLCNYTLSLEHSKLWAVYTASSEREVLNLIAQFPLTKYMEFKIYPLTFNQSANHFLPDFSLN